eukprot:jgi/Botrbrau1/12255/Bobra.0361s0016.1
MAKRRRPKQTARKTTNVNVPARLRTGPPSYNDRIRNGGQQGDRTPDERAAIVKDYVFHLYVGRPLPQAFLLAASPAVMARRQRHFVACGKNRPRYNVSRNSTQHSPTVEVGQGYQHASDKSYK